MNIRKTLIIAAGLFTYSAMICAATDAQTVEHAKAVLASTQGNTVTGTVSFTQETDGVKVVADLAGLSPGRHGFHIHEFGDCSSPDASSAGGHFNPYNEPHAGPEDKMRHEGDMGNVEADASGKAHYEYVDNLLSFHDVSSILGRSVVVHAKADDLQTQPSGDSGGRIACGVIGVAKNAVILSP